MRLLYLLICLLVVTAQEDDTEEVMVSRQQKYSFTFALTVQTPEKSTRKSRDVGDLRTTGQVVMETNVLAREFNEEHTFVVSKVRELPKKNAAQIWTSSKTGLTLPPRIFDLL